jgi:hypothetical protein
LKKQNSAALIAAGIVLAAALLWGLEQAAIAPLETGDVYPAYSSLRSDPLGAKALYESLGALPGIQVERLYKQRTALEKSDAMLVLGVDPVGWSAVRDRTLEEYEKLVQNGGRLVIAFLPVRSPFKLPEKREGERRWDIKLRYGISDASGDAIPRETVLFFEAGPEWRVIPGHNTVERPFAKGSIVLAADTFALSDEGLRDARDANFIAALIGPARRVIFDENHFGVVETGSVTKLMHKYHLEGAVAMLALAAALFLWRSASGFLPPRAVAAADAVTGRDSIEGMTALLHRGVAEKDLLETCFAEWNKSAPRERRVQQVEDEIRRLKDRPVEAYRAASKALTENK